MKPGKIQRPGKARHRPRYSSFKWSRRRRQLITIEINSTREQPPTARTLRYTNVVFAAKRHEARIKQPANSAKATRQFSKSNSANSAKRNGAETAKTNPAETAKRNPAGNSKKKPCRSRVEKEVFKKILPQTVETFDQLFILVHAPHRKYEENRHRKHYWRSKRKTAFDEQFDQVEKHNNVHNRQYQRQHRQLHLQLAILEKKNDYNDANAQEIRENHQPDIAHSCQWFVNACLIRLHHIAVIKRKRQRQKTGNGG